jgi:hypothetical protein
MRIGRGAAALQRQGNGMDLPGDGDRAYEEEDELPTGLSPAACVSPENCNSPYLLAAVPTRRSSGQERKEPPAGGSRWPGAVLLMGSRQVFDGREAIRSLLAGLPNVGGSVRQTEASDRLPCGQVRSSLFIAITVPRKPFSARVRRKWPEGCRFRPWIFDKPCSVGIAPLQ